jgi:hypothetical protein
MKVKTLTVLAIIAAMAMGAVVNASDYICYKARYNYDKYSKSNKKIGRKDKFKVEAYVVINKALLDNGFIEIAEAPQRIVFINKREAKDYTTLARGVRGVFLDPTSLSEYEGNDLGDLYLPWAGEWDVNAFVVNGIYLMSEFLSSITETTVIESAISLAGTANRKTGYPNVYKGVGAVNSGTLTVKDFDGQVLIDSRTQLKYDRKLTQLTQTASTMNDAIAAVNGYLTDKKYASTWN